MTCGIYCIKNKVNNKRYIGQSKNVKNRLNQHLRDLLNNRSSSSVLQRAWNSYGKENFELYPVLLLPNNFSFLMDILEILFIFIFRSHTSQNGYNISWGGNTPMKHRKHTEEEKRKASENNGRYWLGKTRSQETIEKISSTKISAKLKTSDKRKTELSKLNSGRKLFTGKTSKYAGTYKRNDNGKYRSSIKHFGVVYRSKSFVTEDEAALAYDELYKSIQGTLFGPNFPNGYLLEKN